MSQRVWSDDRVALLCKLWLDGRSAAQIANILGGVTRNAVLGKIHRLGLCGRGAPRAADRAPDRAPDRAQDRTSRPVGGRARLAPRPVAALRPPCPGLPGVAPPPEGPGLVRDLRQLGAHACKWPIGDPKHDSFSFCGRPAEGRYCPAHAAAGVRKSPDWRPDRDPILRRALARRL